MPSNNRESGSLGVSIAHDECDDVARVNDVASDMNVNAINDSWGHDFGPMNKDAMHMPETMEPEHMSNEKSTESY